MAFSNLDFERAPLNDGSAALTMLAEVATGSAQTHSAGTAADEDLA